MLFGTLVFMLSFMAFHYAPIRQTGDSRYTMLLADTLFRHGEFRLDRYHLPESDYRIQHVDGHDYYAFPPGASILSVPFVAVMHLGGVSAVRSDGTYDLRGERALDAELAAILMAAFAALAYFSSRLLLPVGWSLAVAGVSAFGTQVFSTASRSMWSDTWGIVLVGLAVRLLLLSKIRAERVHAPLLATLESFAYIVRPTNSIALFGTAIFIVATNRKAVWPFLGTVACWLGLFVLYSVVHFHSLLPDYFAADRLHFPPQPVALLGNLVSPGRGLLVYVPAVAAVGLSMARFWTALRFRALVALSGFVVVCHLFVLSEFAHWWGGHSYGARLTTALVPWFVLLGILVVDAARNATRTRARGTRRADVVLGALVALLCVGSVVVNAIGAFSREANDWNVVPDDIDRTPWRLWSWRRPQFAAPFVEPDGPFRALPSHGLSLGTAEADTYLGWGWASPDGEFRWTDGRGTSTVRFSLADREPGILSLDLGAYLAAGKLREQKLVVSMNNRDLGTLFIRTRDFTRYEIAVPANVSRDENRLYLRHPDAESPAAMEGTPDRRELAVAVRTIDWQRAEPPH
jgi:hypothetical protein